MDVDSDQPAAAPMDVDSSQLAERELRPEFPKVQGVRFAKEKSSTGTVNEVWIA